MAVTERYKNGGSVTVYNSAKGESAPNTGTSKYGLSSGNNNYTGATGKNYSVAGSNGTITVNRPDGSQSIVRPTDPNYKVTQQAMQKDLQSNGVNYTPNTTYTNSNGTYTAKSYTQGNRDLQYALQQAAKQSAGGYWEPAVGTFTGNTGKKYTADEAENILVTRTDGTTSYVRPADANYIETVKAMNADGVSSGKYTNYTNAGLSVEDYVESLYNRVGTTRKDDTVVSLQDVTNELTRLGLSDYLPGKAIYTARGKLIPGNEFVEFKDNNGMTSNSEDSRWASYGGQDYLIDGDSSNYVNYVNALLGKYNNMDYIFGGADMANNPYAQQNPEFLAQFNNTLAQLYANGGMNLNANGAVTNNNVNVNQQLGGLLDYTDSLGQLNNATGRDNYSSDLWSQIQALLQSGLDNNTAFLESQQAQAERNAEDLARQAWINSKLQGDSVKEALSASGLGATGALQSAQLGVQNNFNNSLANINSSLNDMTTTLNEQKLAALTDHNRNLAEYAYQIQNDEANRALQNAQLAMQQQEYQNALQQQQWQNAYNQQLLDMQRQEYSDNLAKTQADAENDRKAQQASYYADLYRIGRINGAQYQQYLQQLGLI